MMIKGHGLGLSLFILVLLLAALCGKEYQYIAPKHDRPEYVQLFKDKFPIIAWTGIDAAESALKFPLMRDCGINTYLGWYDSLDEVVLALENAEKAGVKAILSCGALQTDTEKTVGKMKAFPALLGYHITDEPETSDFPALKARVTKIQEYDTDHPCYINVYPNWAWGENDYEANLKRFLHEVPVPFLSFDNYPVYTTPEGKTVLRKDWFKNLEEVRNVSNEYGIPFWAFALALAHSIPGYEYPIPTLAHLRLQQFCNLAYGAQAFQYFTWWGICHEGPTQVYDRVKQVNSELQGLAGIFLDAEVKEVWHTGPELPAGTKALGTLPSQVKNFATSGKGAVVSLVEKGGSTYLTVVNKDFENALSLSISAEASVRTVSKKGDTSSLVPNYSIEPGDIIVFKLK